MDTIRIVLVEDERSEIDSFNMSLAVFNKLNKEVLQVELQSVTTVDEALGLLEKDNNFDGAVIDLKLDKGGDEGNDVIKKILADYRIPISVFSGTPSNISEDINRNLLKVFTRDEPHAALFEHVVNIYKTGLTKILGGRGEIEKTMNRVFRDNILPQLESWTKYSSDNVNTEKALLRYIVGHLTELLSESDTCFREEVYINPPIHREIKTGSIIREKETGSHYVVLTPACDIVKREGGKCNTDRILLCAIEKKNDEDLALENNDKIKSLTKNKSGYLHWLPEVKGFSGGLVNFRYISSIDENEFKSNYDGPHMQISNNFIKDIISRFSSYYARQGQPDFDFDRERAIIASKKSEKS